MADRNIECSNCGKPMGVIRDATLRVGISYTCGPCKASIKSQLKAYSAARSRDYINKSAQGDSKAGDFINDILRGKAWHK